MLISKEYKNSLVVLAPIFCWITFMVSVYMPFLVYRVNSEYYSESFLQLILPIIVFVVAIMLCLLLLVGFVNKKAMPYLSSVLMIWSVLMWLQGDLFSISYGQLDGLGLVFYTHDFRGMIEIIVLAACTVFAILFRKKINALSSTLIVLLFLAQLGVIVFGLISVNEKQFDQKVTSDQTIDDELFAYSTRKNIVVVVLDSFGAEFFQQMIKQNDSFNTQLDGFVNYSDAISQYPQTKSSLPSFFTGEMIPEGVNYANYLTGMVADKGMPKQFEKQGYLVSVISTAYFWFKDFYSNRFLYSPPVSDKPMLFSSTPMKLLDYGLFRVAPHVLKHRIYNKGFWLVSDFMSGYNRVPDIYPTRAVKMMDYYFPKIFAADEIPRFKFLHFVLPHPKFVYDRNCEFKQNIKYTNDAMLQQSICAMKKMLLMFEKMKQQNVYDNSTIVVMSDHGARMFKSREEIGMPAEFELKSSGGLLLIKRAGSKGVLQQDDTPVSLIGVHDFLLKNLNGTDEKTLPAEHERLYYSYQSEIGSNKANIPDGVVYRVGPGYSSAKSWTPLSAAVSQCRPIDPVGKISLKLNQENSSCYRYGFKEYSDSINGIEMLGGEGMIVWLTNSAVEVSADQKYEINVVIESKGFIQAKLQINSDYLNAKQMTYNKDKQVLSVQLTELDLRQETKFELLINQALGAELTGLTSRVIVKSIEVKLVK